MSEEKNASINVLSRDSAQEDPMGLIEKEVRDTKFALDDLESIIGELHAKIMPVLGEDMRTSPQEANDSQPVKMSTNSQMYEELHKLNQKAYMLQSVVRNITERVEL